VESTETADQKRDKVLLLSGTAGVKTVGIVVGNKELPDHDDGAPLGYVTVVKPPLFHVTP
jgi:hypothetical protein